MSKPRTEAGKRLIRDIYGGKSRSREDYERLLGFVLAIEAEALDRLAAANPPVAGEADSSQEAKERDATDRDRVWQRP